MAKCEHINIFSRGNNDNDEMIIWTVWGECYEFSQAQDGAQEVETRREEDIILLLIKP